MSAKELDLARKEISIRDRTIATLQKDLGSRSEHDLSEDECYLNRVHELENDASEKAAVINELQEQLRAFQDNCDELKAENERLNQKNVAQKRALQKSKSSSSLPRTSSMGSRR